jgi:hypothetical protein
MTYDSFQSLKDLFSVRINAVVGGVDQRWRANAGIALKWTNLYSLAAVLQATVAL